MTRDLVGHGPSPPAADWPGGARVALSIVLNVEAGSERSVEQGDGGSEPLLHDLSGSPPVEGDRHLGVESLFEYGARAGVWRVLRLVEERAMVLTAFATGQALERAPAVGEALAAGGHEVAGHGYRWIDYRTVGEDVEAEHVRRTIEVIERTTGTRPVGWYTGRRSARTRRLLVEAGGFAYDSDAYDDDLPHWVAVGGRHHLVVPYALDTNDIRFVVGPGFATGRQFADYLTDALDLLAGEATPRMMSVGLHPRLVGRPGRAAGLARFLDRVRARDDVWVCRRRDLAAHWALRHPPPSVD